MSVKADELVSWIQAEIHNAKGYHGDELAAVRKKALDRYYGRPRGDEQPGRSKAQSNDIADMVEAIVAQVLPAFSQDDVAEFEPRGEQDEETVVGESRAVNTVIAEENNGYTMWQESLRNALLLRNGWNKAELDERERVSEPEYKNISPMAAAQILQSAARQGEVEILESTIEPDTDQSEVSIRYRLTRTDKRLVVRAVDPVLMSWNRDHDSIYLENIRFLSERWHPTRSTLIRMGYPKAKVNRILGYSGPSEAQDFGRDELPNTDAEARDKSEQRLRCRWLHYRYDSDGDGMSELHRILYAEDAASSSDAILEDEIVDFIPYATGTAILQPHRLDGLGLYDKLEGIEDDKTGVLRQWFDNQKTSNQPGLAVNANMADAQAFVARRPGMAVNIDGPPGEAVMPIPVVDIGQSSIGALQYLDKVRSERAGASLDLQAQQTLVAGDTAHGIERQISAKELMAAMMTRTLSETLVRQTYVLTHTAMRLWLTEPVPVRIAGEVQEVLPAAWPERDRVNVKTGLSVAERMHKRDVLGFILAEQKTLWQSGEQDVMVTREAYHNALIDYTRAVQVDNGERYFPDPTSEQAKQALQSKQQQSEQMQAIQLQIAQLAASSEQQKQQIENALDAWKTEQDNAVKLYIESMKAELELIKAGNPEGSGEDVTAFQQGAVTSAQSRTA